MMRIYLITRHDNPLMWVFLIANKSLVSSFVIMTRVKSFTQLHLSEIPLEEAHGGTGARQMLIKPEYLTTPYLEAVTKGFLNVGKMFDWHNHLDTDEIFIVTQGEGEYHYKLNGEEKLFTYKPDDIVIAPANLFHKIVASGDEQTQGFFFRIKGHAKPDHEYTFKHFDIANVPFEMVHDIPNSRQTLVTTDSVATDYLEALTKGTLPAGNVWDWHDHVDTDEVSIVLAGEGTYFIDDVQVPYKQGDVFVIPANAQHKIVSAKDTEFYFIRVLSK